MNQIKISVLISFGAVFVAAMAQIILKKSAEVNRNEKFWRKFINIWVIVGYAMMLLSSLLNVYALRAMPLNFIPIAEASGYIWVPLLSWILLKKKPTKRNIIGSTIIISGMLLFAMGCRMNMRSI